MVKIPFLSYYGGKEGIDMLEKWLSNEEENLQKAEEELKELEERLQQLKAE